jgi:chromosome partitioning protein
MAPLVVSITGQKGGVGKSTAATCLAWEAKERGRRVLLVDADPQATARTWADVGQEAGHAMPTVVAMGATMHKPEQLPRVAEAFDLVVIDCPPRAGDVQRSALMVCTLALLPCGPSAADAWALAGTLELVREAQTLRPELLAAVLLTRKQPRTSVGQSARQVLADSELPLLKSELGYRVAYQEALAAGLGVTSYAPASDAAAEVRALFDEVIHLGGLHAGKGKQGKGKRTQKARRA